MSQSEYTAAWRPHPCPLHASPRATPSPRTAPHPCPRTAPFSPQVRERLQPILQPHTASSTEGTAGALAGASAAGSSAGASGASSSSARYTVQVAAAGSSPAVARGGWTDGGAAGAQHLYRIEGDCDLRGVPLRYGGRFFLRTVHCVRDGYPSGCHLEADPEAGDQERAVRARRVLRGEAQALVAHRPAKAPR